MVGHRFIIREVKYDLFLGLIGFGFCKYSFKKTSLTFLFDWALRLGIIGIQKWQSKEFKELKKMADVAWDEKWKEAGYKADPKKGVE